MKEIFDWLKKRMNQEEKECEEAMIHPSWWSAKKIVDEAEAKWEAEGIPMIHGKAELELHDKEIRTKAIEEFSKLLIGLNNEFPTVEDDYGEIRPMWIEEMCEKIALQMKGEKE